MDENITNVTYENASYAHSEDETTNGLASNGIHTPSYILISFGFFNALLFLIGVVGNIMVIFVVIRVREMRTSINYCFVNLSVADLLVLLICQPSAMVEFYGEDRWFLGDVMCQLVPFLENTVINASILTILTVSFERYYAICHPLRDYCAFNARRTGQMILFIWTTASLTSVPFLLLTFIQESNFYDGSIVYVCRTHFYLQWHFGYLIAGFCLFFVIPFFSLIGLYCAIIRAVAREAIAVGSSGDNHAVNSIKGRKQIVAMLLGIVTLFFVCLLPMRVVAFWVIYTPKHEMEQLGLEASLNIINFARIMIYVNSAGNPVIYSLMSTKFRNAARCVCGLYNGDKNYLLRRSTLPLKYVYPRVHENSSTTV